MPRSVSAGQVKTVSGRQGGTFSAGAKFCLRRAAERSTARLTNPGLPMRQIALACICLTVALALTGCGAPKPWRDSSLGAPRPPPNGDGPVMRRVMGQDPGVEPLLPEPGDIWADVVPNAQPALPEPPKGLAARPQVATVQLAAADSAKRAEAEWKRLRQRLPKIVRDHRPEVTMADVAGRKVWRLRTGGFATVAEADAFCASVRAVKSQCWVVGSSD